MPIPVPADSRHCRLQTLPTPDTSHREIILDAVAGTPRATQERPSSASLHRPLNKLPKRTYTKYKQADWENFTQHTDNTLVEFNRNNYTNIGATIKDLTRQSYTTANNISQPGLLNNLALDSIETLNIKSAQGTNSDTSAPHRISSIAYKH